MEREKTFEEWREICSIRPFGISLNRSKELYKEKKL